MKENKKLVFPFVCFCAGIVLMLGFITMLKFTNPYRNIVPFLLCFLGMQAGIQLLMLGEFRFQGMGINPRKYYKEFYYYTAIYFPILGYKFIIAKIWPSTFMGDEYFLVLMLAITAYCLYVSIRTMAHFGAALNRGDVPAFCPETDKPGFYAKIGGTFRKNRKK